MKIVFPPNPSDGEIFEAIQGLFFQYRASDNSWIRIDGSDALPIASPLQDGIMTAEDLRKLMGLIIPPPQASLKGEDCTQIYKQGKIGLYSKDGSLVIEPNLTLMGGSQTTNRPFDLHRNTVAINFRLNMEQFLDEVKKRGNLIERKVQGDQGDSGDKGDAGRDQLDTGPVGADGQKGTNSPFAGSLIEESLDLRISATDEPRAIVDVTTEQVSETENYVIFTRANIGNPDACPSEVIPKPIKSPWVMIVQTGVQNINKLSKLTDDCGISCAVCSGQIYYLNIDPIMSEIFDRFKDKVTDLKKAKEQLVSSWLKAMVFLFNQQKAALCCALENCRSRGRNVATRQYVETQRIQAAQANFSLVIDGAEDKKTVDLDEYKTCAKPSTQISEYVKENLDAGCGDWLYELTIDASIHNRDPRTSGNSGCLMFSLPRGSYYAQITGCCASIGNEAAKGMAGEQMTVDSDGKSVLRPIIMAGNNAFRGEPAPNSPNDVIVHDSKGNRQLVSNLDVGNVGVVDYQSRKGFTDQSKFTGRVAMVYQRSISVGTDKEDIEQGVVQIPDLGLFDDPSMARSAYLGVTTRFSHAGGAVQLWVPNADANGLASSGKIVVGIQRVECLDTYLNELPEGRRALAIEEGTAFRPPIYAYRGRVAFQNVIGAITPYTGDIGSIANYGLTGSNAHIQNGPALEGKVLKVFFYEGPDGISFFLVQNKPGEASDNTSRIFISIDKSYIGNAALVSNEPGDLIFLNSPSTKRLLGLPSSVVLYDGLFKYSNRTAGGVIGYFDSIVSTIRDWEVILDPVDTGNIVMIKAADGKDNTELVLAQGPVKVNYDFSSVRDSVAQENTTSTQADNKNAWGSLLTPVVGTGEESWWFKFIGDPGGSSGMNPYSLFDGTYCWRAPDTGTGLIFGVFNAVQNQSIRLWRDYVDNALEIVEAVDNYEGKWYNTYQAPNAIRLYTVNQTAKEKYYDQTKPITIKDLMVLCTSYETPATTFSVTIIDKDGNAFVFPDRTIRQKTDPNQLSWVSFGAPTNNDVVVIESDPTTLESPPTGTIIGTKVTGEFKETLDLRKIKRVMIDIKNAEGNRYVLGVHTIAAMLNGIARWPDGHTKNNVEPDAYAIIEAMSIYWRYSPPANGYPALPDNVQNNNLMKWWSPQAVTDNWHIIPGYDKEAVRCASGSGVCDIAKSPLDEIRNNRIIFTTIPPTGGCQMHWKQVDWLERGHRIGAACSFYVVIDGMGFIVVKRSIGVDTSCGGGESEDNPCVATFIASGDGHPAIAWPSIDGEEFVGKPSSGYTTFLKDDDLSMAILTKLAAGDVNFVHGDPVNNIPLIIFPSL